MPISISGTTGVSLVTDASITPVKLTQPYTLGSPVATTSGTAIDYTSIPSWVNCIRIFINEVSTNGVNGFRLQLGTAGGLETTGYISNNGVYANANVTGTATNPGIGFDHWQMVAAATYRGIIELRKFSSSTNTWICNWSTSSTEARIFHIVGLKTLAGTLDRVRFTTVGSTDTFDSGALNIQYE